MRNESSTSGSVLLVGASRGLGYGVAVEFLRRGWDVTGTVRGHGQTQLHELVEEHAGRLAIESLDIIDRLQIQALRGRLADRCFDVLFVSAGTGDQNQDQTIEEV